MNAPYNRDPGPNSEDGQSRPEQEAPLPRSEPWTYTAEGYADTDAQKPRAQIPYGQGRYDQAPDAQQSYDQGRYDQGPYDQGRYDQGPYDQGPYEQPPYDQGRYDRPHEQGRYDQGPYAQPPHDQGPYVADPHGSDPYARIDPERPAPAQDRHHTMDLGALKPNWSPAQPSAPHYGPGPLEAAPGGPPQTRDSFPRSFEDRSVGDAKTAQSSPTAPDTKPPGGRASDLLKSSALMAAGTIVSRLTGFLRTLVMAAAIGVGTLNDTYQVANVLPTMIYVLVCGGALNSVFIPQLVRAMKEDEDGGEAYANRLMTLVLVLLGAITVISVLGAPLLVQMMSPSLRDDPQRLALATTFARYCLPTMFFMGAHVLLGQVLNARGRFGAMMWTPVLNNVLIIASFGGFIWAFGTFSQSGISAHTITPEGVRLLGIGTLLGLVVQALAMVPYVRETGARLRLRFDWRGHGLGKALGLAKWTLLFVLANQLGLIVVTQLATWAGPIAEKQGHPGTGVTAYNFALQLWQMPQAIITVSVMTAVLPRIARAANDGDTGAVRDDISYGLRTSAVAVVPCAFAFLALGVPMATLLYATAGSGARNIGYILMAFSLGLIPYSVQYVVLRGFHAFEDTRTPFYNTVIVALVNAAGAGVSFVVLPARWAVVGMAASYGLAFAVGVGVAWRRLRNRLDGDLDGARVIRTYVRLITASIPAALVSGAVAYLLIGALGSGALGSSAALVVGGLVLIVLYIAVARRLKVDELNGMLGMVRARIGR
ncbi:murein biosynthesis integral membrane protein MurJ [Streptomyces sp. NPDC056544]|uniref:murein biosynthesis integral membrane protein MurJ n=1 Tax=unclassified Streptomyces TaxID=2593676 RepID=UPI0036B6AC38